MKYKYSKIYWFFSKFEWMKVYFSPFKFFLPKLYVGKVAIGTPYFLPRKWVNATPERAHKATEEYIKREENYNKLNPKSARKIKSYDNIFQDKLKCSYTIPKKIGFDFVSLGYKTKWSSTDYRHEWNPIWSFVFFGYQIALIFRPENDCHYWECYLYYSRDTKGTAEDRLEQAKKEFPCIWTIHSNGGEEKINYWDIIIKKKFTRDEKDF